MKKRILFLLVAMMAFCFVVSSNARAVDVAREDLAINSPDELIELLAEMGVENPEAILDEDGGISIIEACKNVSLTPSSIVATKPFKIKFYQIMVSVTIGDCGNILCSTMGYDMTWEPGPNAGATLIGPIPSEPTGQVCVGNSTSTKGFLILKSDVPNGRYNIKVKVGGFASAEYYYLPVTVQ
jgi:hypothetical protein